MAQKFEKVPNQSNLFLDVDSGIFYVRVMVRGRVKWRSTRVTTLKTAISAARVILGQLEEGAGEAKRVPTVEEFWALYRKAKEKQKSPLTWLKEDRLMNKHVLPQFGKVRLDELSGLQLERFLNWRRHKVGEGTVNNEGALLHAFLQVAVREGVIDRNPLWQFKQQPYKSRTRVLSRDEQDKLEAIMSPLQQRWLRFRLATGVRCEELEGIVAERDFDWVGTRVQVTGKGYRGVKKTRWVPLIPSHLDEIRTLVSTQVEWVRTQPRAFKNGQRLFPQVARAWADQLERACANVGVEGVTPHILRHTFATRYLQGGGDIYILSKILGHASVSVTESVYAHLLTEDLSARSVGIAVL